MKQPLVHQRDETHPFDCPFGHVQRIVTGGAGGVANVHAVEITKGTPHVHTGCDEVYYGPPTLIFFGTADRLAAMPTTVAGTNDAADGRVPGFDWLPGGGSVKVLSSCPNLV